LFEKLARGRAEPDQRGRSKKPIQGLQFGRAGLIFGFSIR
jgi:hypothetical protein